MAGLMLVNPKKRRKSTAKRKTVRRAKRHSTGLARVTKSVGRRRRNPIPKMTGIVSTLKDGAIGAAGAVLTEIVLSKLPLPASVASGNGRVAMSALGSIGVGMMVAKFGKNRDLGKKMAQGGVTVALHSLMRGAVSGIPGVELSGNGLLGMEDGLLGSDMNDLGYYSSAPTYESLNGHYSDDNDF